MYQPPIGTVLIWSSLNVSNTAFYDCFDYMLNSKGFSHGQFDALVFHYSPFFPLHVLQWFVFKNQCNNNSRDFDLESV